MDITAPDILGLLTAGVLISALVAGPLVFYGIRAVLRKLKPRPVSAQFRTSGRQAEPRGTFDEGCYRALLREVTKKRHVK